MKFQFDAHLPHQGTAINAVLGVFEGSRAIDGRDYATEIKVLKTGSTNPATLTVKRGDDLHAKSDQVHDGCFSGDKSGWKDTSGTTTQLSV
jgi:hypothetical protein